MRTFFKMNINLEKVETLIIGLRHEEQHYTCYLCVHRDTWGCSDKTQVE